MEFQKFVEKVELYLMRHLAPQEVGIVRKYWKKKMSPRNVAVYLHTIERLRNLLLTDVDFV